MASHSTQINEQSIGCVSRAVKILGNKWTPLIIKEMNDGAKRFCQIESQLPGISPRTLSQRLDDLEEFGIVDKRSFAQMPPKVEYTLTQKGQDLLPVLQSMADWGAKHSC